MQMYLFSPYSQLSCLLLNQAFDIGLQRDSAIHRCSHRESDTNPVPRKTSAIFPF